MQNKFLFFLTYILFYINIIYCFVSITKIIFKYFLAKSNCYNQRGLFYIPCDHNTHLYKIFRLRSKNFMLRFSSSIICYFFLYHTLMASVTSEIENRNRNLFLADCFLGIQTDIFTYLYIRY